MPQRKHNLEHSELIILIDPFYLTFSFSLSSFLLWHYNWIVSSNIPNSFSIDYSIWFRFHSSTSWAYFSMSFRFVIFVLIGYLWIFQMEFSSPSFTLSVQSSHAFALNYLSQMSQKSPSSGMLLYYYPIYLGNQEMLVFTVHCWSSYLVFNFNTLSHVFTLVVKQYWYTLTCIAYSLSYTFLCVKAYSYPGCILLRQLLAKVHCILNNHLFCA